MSLRKALMLPVLAMAALACGAAPAAAAPEWTHEGMPLAEPMPFTMHGTVGVMVGVSSYECETHVEGIVTEGSTGFIEGITPTTGKCKGTGGFEGCTLVAHSAENLPYVIHATETKIDVTEVALFLKFGNCLIPQITATFPSMTIDPEQPASFENMHVHAKEGIIDVGGIQLGKAEAFGSLVTTPAKTFGIVY